MHAAIMPMIDTYEPALMCVGVILAPLESVRDAAQSQLEKIIDKNTFDSKLESISWREFFKRDGQFYDILRAEIALFSPQESVTIYVCNLADGWSSLYGNLVKASAFDAYFFRAALPATAEYKVFEMEMWQRGILVRHVCALQEEDGWRFLSSGKPLPFEHSARYKKREIGARLDRNLIDDYSEAAGYRMSSVTKFDGPCWRFWRNG